MARRRGPVRRQWGERHFEDPTNGVWSLGRNDAGRVMYYAGRTPYAAISPEAKEIADRMADQMLDDDAGFDDALLAGGRQRHAMENHVGNGDRASTNEIAATEVVLRPESMVSSKFKDERELRDVCARCLTWGQERENRVWATPLEAIANLYVMSRDGKLPDDVCVDTHVDITPELARDLDADGIPARFVGFAMDVGPNEDNLHLTKVSTSSIRMAFNVCPKDEHPISMFDAYPDITHKRSQQVSREKNLDQGRTTYVGSLPYSYDKNAVVRAERVDGRDLVRAMSIYQHGTQVMRQMMMKNAGYPDEPTDTPANRRATTSTTRPNSGSDGRSL